MVLLTVMFSPSPSCCLLRERASRSPQASIRKLRKQLAHDVEVVPSNIVLSAPGLRPAPVAEGLEIAARIDSRWTAAGDCVKPERLARVENTRFYFGCQLGCIMAEGLWWVSEEARLHTAQAE
jgi:hypothetical protein